MTDNLVALIAPMTEREVDTHIAAINDDAAEIDNRAADMAWRLNEIKTCEGWRAKGFTSWTAFLDSDLFESSRKHLYTILRGVQVQERLSPAGYNLSLAAAYALAAYEEDLQPAIARAAVARYGKPTASAIRRTGDILTEVANTGHVDIGDGTSTPINAAFAQADYEAAMRQKQHIADKRGALVWAGEAVLKVDWEFATLRPIVPFVELDKWGKSRNVRIVVYEQIEG